MKRSAFCILLLVFIFSVPRFASALQQDNIQIYMKPDAIKSFEIVLPDDLGTLPKGRVEYLLVMQPSTGTWSDLSERRHFSDENNTIIDAVRFSSAGRSVGECGSAFSLTISAVGKNVPARMITGRACVSDLEDVDSPAAGSANTANSDAGIFDLSLDRRVIYSAPGQAVQISVSVQSYSNISVELAVEGIEAGPRKRVVELDGNNRTGKSSFSLSALEEGEYNFTVTGKVRNCASSFCVKAVQGKVAVSRSVQEESGFSVSLTPANLNTERLGSVEYTIMVRNKGAAKRISLRLEAPQDIETTFFPQTVEVPEDSEKSVAFIAMPKKTEQAYQLTAIASHSSSGQREITKKATAYLSTDELFTDAVREAESIKDAEGQRSAARLVDQWLTEGGDEADIGEYESLREKLDSLKREEPSADEEIGEEIAEEFEESQPFNFMLIPIAATAIGGVAFLAYFLRRRKKADEGFGL